MKIDLGTGKKFHEKLGQWFSNFGVALFLLFFWCPLGIHLGGDPLFLGPYQPSLDVIFPFIGISFFIIFIGQLLNKTAIILPKKFVIFSIFLLALFAVSAIFSGQPEVSMLFLIIWITAFLSLSFGAQFFLESPWKKYVFFFGIIIGFLMQKSGYLASTFNLEVSLDLLAIAALILAIFIRLTPLPKGKNCILLLVLFWIIFESQNILLIVLTLTLWIGAHLWIPKTRKGESIVHIFVFLFLLCLSLWGIFQEHFSFEATAINHITHWKNFFIGVGDGQYLRALQDFSPTLLRPEELTLPSYGIILTYYEKGILGILTILGLLCGPMLLSGKNKRLRSFVFLIFWVSSISFLGTENGILFAIAFLFATKEDKISKFLNLNH